ncbi:MAG: proline dehydrogenase family protein, partial [Burkholderiales bacterium]
MAAHFRAYLRGFSLGGAWGRLLKLGESPLLAPAVRASVERLARSFLVEEAPGAIQRVTRNLARLPASATFDAVGEAVLTEAEADRYLQRNLDLIDWIARDGARLPNLSIKLSALTARFDPIDPAGSRHRALERLRRLMPRIQAAGATLTVDMEHHDLKVLVIETFMELFDEYPGRNWTPGIALQAYLRSARDDLAGLIAAAKRAQRRICIRLVKGAYWDTEVAMALQREWPQPVLPDKAQTDAQYEELVGMLFDAGECVYPAIASHNVRSLAYSIAQARLRGRPAASWEVQMLFGMAEPLAEAVARSGTQLRIYVPTGDLISGIAYLVRRLVENTANSSVLRQTWVESTEPQVLLAAPRADSTRSENPAPEAGFRNTPLLDFSQEQERTAFAEAIAAVRPHFGVAYPLAVRGCKGAKLPVHESVDPANPSQVLARIEQASRAQAAQAVENANMAYARWHEVPVRERAALLLAAADLMRERRYALAAWQVFEVGKNWREADADVAEAIDFLRYYAVQARELGEWRTTRSYPGERNETRYEPRGIAAVIAPWNFPLAILAGMTSAALVTGNAVIMKPARPSQIVAQQLSAILTDAGLPPDVCQILPGPGAEVGNFLVDHPLVSSIAFTASRSVGFDIQRRCGVMQPGQRLVKRVVCEMGGKNAIIVDRDADLDEAVAETLASAFGYQGQKCSAA